MDISVLIPSYNGGRILSDLVSIINKNLSGKHTYEIIFVFDDGNITTWRILKELINEFPEIINIYRLARNYGQHRAIQFGMSKAKGDFIVTIDEDLQHDPADILKLIEKQKEGNYNIVYGKFQNLQHRGIRNILSEMLRRVLRNFIPYLYENYSPYRLIRRETAYMTLSMVSPYIFIDDLLCQTTQNIASVDIIHYPRSEGQSSYTSLKVLWHAVLIILNYSSVIYWLFATGGILIFTGFILTNQLSSNFVNIPSFYTILIWAGFFLAVGGSCGILIKYLNKKRNSNPVKTLI